MGGQSTDEAMNAIGAAHWTWSSGERRLVVHAAPGGHLAHLDGAWSLPAFLALMEGLSRDLVASAFEGLSRDRRLDVRASLMDGRSVHLIGAADLEGVGRGLLIPREHAPELPAFSAAIVPVFQPIRRLSDLSIAGFEALVRFRDLSRPGDELLEAQPANVDWRSVAPVMLGHAIRVLKALRDQGREVFMQVNFTAADLAHPDLVEVADDLIASAGLPDGVLRIELTEQAALRDLDGALGVLGALKAAGAGLVLDDFGAGHSSLVWLAQMPANGVKLDQALVRLASGPRGARIIEGIVQVIHDLGMTVTAEGVEDPDLARIVADLGCDHVQGFAFDHPLREEAIDPIF
ncbi:MAG: EAL domain-containing protein [Hyphomonadaceae bacterium]